MTRYIVVELGKSAYTEFKKKHGEFQETEDAVVVGFVHENSAEKAIQKVKKFDYCKDRVFDDLVAYQIL